MKQTHLALAPFLRFCPSVMTIGIRASFEDYSAEEKKLLRCAHRIFFPTPRFAGLFEAVGTPTFPHASTYLYQRSNLHQMLLFQYLKWPHPRTRIYFGWKQKQSIPRDFRFPFLAIGPRASPLAPRIIRNMKDLEQHAFDHNPLIIQEAIDWIERIRFICVHYECVGALRQTATAEDPTLEPILLEHKSLSEILQATRRLLRMAQLDDISVVWAYGNGQWQLIQLERPPARWKSLEGTQHRHHLICHLIQTGFL